MLLLWPCAAPPANKVVGGARTIATSTPTSLPPMHLHVLLSATLTAAVPYKPKPPRFSWDTMPVFIHGSNASGPINSDAIRLMAKFPLVTVEKFQGRCANSKDPTPACDQEKLIIDALKQVKEIDANVSTIFYYNSVLDFPQYKLHGMMLDDPELMLRDKNGKTVMMHCPSPAGKCDVFDFSNAKTRALFISECVNATQTGFVDGCFLDRAVDGTPTDSGNDQIPCSGENCRYQLNLTAAQSKAYAAGHVKVLTGLQVAIGEGPVIANHAYGPPHDNMAKGTVSFDMIEGFGPNNASINQLLLSSANSRGVQAHGKNSEDCVAAFLIGAGFRAYFGLGGWSEKSLTFDGHWLPQFAMPLGEPLSDAVYTSVDKTWRREFKSGVKVEFSLETKSGNITGGPWTNSFQRHGKPPPPPEPPLPKPTANCPVVQHGGWSHGDIKSTTASDWSTCCALCRNAVGCAHWVYSSQNPADSRCHLHTANATWNAGPGHVSGTIKHH